MEQFERSCNKIKPTRDYSNDLNQPGHPSKQVSHDYALLEK